MDLVRSWLGQALRATGAAVVVPVAVLVALSLTSMGGAGLGGLGALSQVISGPDAAGTGSATGDSDDEILKTVKQLAARDVPLGPVVPGGGGAPGRNGGGTGGGGGGTGGGGGDTGGGDRGGGGGGGTPSPRPGPKPDPRPPVDDPEPPPPEPPGIIEGVGDTVNGVTGETPAGPTVEEAIDGLMEACGRLNCP